MFVFLVLSPSRVAMVWWDAHGGGGKWSDQQLLSAAVCVSLSSILWPLTFNFCFSFHFFVSATPRSVRRPLCLFSLWSAKPSPSSSSCFFQSALSLYPRPPSTPPISLLCHFSATSISRAGTPEETATPKNSATTIMSTLSSRNNTRINLPSGLGGGGETMSSFGGSLSDLASLDGVSTLHRLVLVEV